MREDSKCVLIDWSLSFISWNNISGRNIKGTCIFNSPEIFFNDDVNSTDTQKTDIWALGCVIYKIITEKY